MWNVESGVAVRDFGDRFGTIRAVSFLPDERYALLGTHEGIVSLVDTETGAIVAEFGTDAPVRYVIPLTERTFVVADIDGHLHLLDLVDPLPSPLGRV
jgi:hypothetical protein